MATTISDLSFVPQVFANYVQNDLRKKSAFFQSQAVSPLSVSLPLHGKTIVVPGWAGLGGDAEVLDGGVCLSDNALVSDKNVAPILRRGKFWSSESLINELTGSSPFAAISAKVATFWTREHDKALVASAIGAATALSTDYAGQITLDISAAATDGAVIGGGSLIAARALFGEYQADDYVLVMHPAAFGALASQDLNDNQRDSTGGNNLPMYQGMRVVLSNSASLVSSGTYTTLIVRPGAFGYAKMDNASQEFEVDRDIKCGVDQLATRQHFIVHPYGAQWIGTAAADGGPTNAELATGTNWDKATADPLDFGIRVLKSKIVPNA